MMGKIVTIRKSWRQRFRGMLMAFVLLFGLVGAPFAAIGIPNAEAATIGWTNNEPIVPTNVQSLAEMNGTLYAGTNSSNDAVWTYNGSAWTQLSGSPGNVSSLIADSSGVLYAGTSNGVYTYSNSTWMQVGTNAPSGVTSLLDVSGVLYAGTSNGVYTYSGGTWTQVGAGQTYTPSKVTSLLDVSGTVYAGTQNDYVDSYSGGTWSHFMSTSYAVYSMVEYNSTLYAGTGNGSVVYMSGSSQDELNVLAYPVKSLVVFNGGLYAGMGGGGTGSSSSNGLTVNRITASTLLVINSTLYAVSNGFVTMLNGSGSLLVPVGALTNVTSLLDVNGTLYAGTYNGSNDVSMYSGGTWTPVGSGQTYTPSDVTSLIDDVNGTLYAGTENGSNDVSMYSGGTWTQVGPSQTYTPSYVTSLIDVNGTLYAGNGRNAVSMYSNGKWTQVGANQTNTPSDVTSLIDFNGTLYAGTGNGSNDVSMYSGGKWTQVGANQTNTPSNVNSLLDVNGTLYAGTYNGSNDVSMYSNGKWTPVGSGQTYTPSYVNSLLDVNGTLYAGTYNGSNDVSMYNGGMWTQVGAKQTNTPSYVYSLIDVNGALYAGGSREVQSLLVPPGTPSNVQVSTTATSITLTWNQAPGASAYNVYENGGSTPIAKGLTGTSYQQTGITPGTSSTFTIQAVNAAGASVPSAAVTAIMANIGSIAMTTNSTNVLTGSKVTVNGVVYDVYGVPVPYAVVDMSSSDGTLSSPVSADENGQFTDTWTAPTVTTETPEKVTASVYGTVYGPIANTVTPTTLSFEVSPLPSSSTGGSGGTSTSGGSSSSTGGSGGTSTSGGSSSTTTSTTSTTSTSTSTTTSTPTLPTVVTSHTFSSAGGTVQQSQGNMTINVNVPQGAFVQPETLTVTTGSAANVTKLVGGLSKPSVAVVLGVNFSGATPSKSVTVTITNPSILANAVIYKLTSGGGLVPMKASVSAGKAVVSFTSDPDLVVLNVLQDQRVITMLGHASIVPAVVQTDPVSKNKTTYMPIWYVMQMLKSLNIQSTWNGHNWHMTTANQPALGTLSPGTGSMHLYVNGKLMQNVTGVYAKDPSTEKNTTYMPIWYVMQMLNKLSIRSSWNGTTWTLTNNAAQSGSTSSAN